MRESVSQVLPDARGVAALIEQFAHDKSITTSTQARHQREEAQSRRTELLLRLFLFVIKHL